MKELGLHIEYLLRSHDCVIVPGIGAFLAGRRPAHVNSQAGIVMPGNVDIYFNGAIAHDDGLLADSFARRQSLTFEDGRAMATAAADHLRAALAQGTEVTIGRIGTLSRGSEDNIRFTPCEAMSHMPETLGYHAVALPRMSADRTLAAAQGHRSDERNYYIAVSKRALHIAATAAVVIIASFAVMFTSYGDTPAGRQYASVMPVTPKEDVADAAGIIAAAEETQPADTHAEDSPNEDVETTPAADKHLIVATFRTQAEAETFIASNNSDTWPLKAIAGKRLVRVAAASSFDRSELQQTLNSKSFSSRFPQAWIYAE